MKGPPPNRQLIVSHLQSFGARLDIEIIRAPQPVAANRTGSANAYLSGPPTTYIHFINNQVRNSTARRTIRLEDANTDAAHNPTARELPRVSRQN